VELKVPELAGKEALKLYGSSPKRKTFA